MDLFGIKKRQKQIDDLYKALDIATDCIDMLNKKVVKLQQESAVYKYGFKKLINLPDSIYEGNFETKTTETKIN